MKMEVKFKVKQKVICGGQQLGEREGKRKAEEGCYLKHCHISKATQFCMLPKRTMY